MFARKLSIRAALVIRMAAVLLVAISVVGVYTYVQATTEANDLAKRVIRQTSGLIDQRIGSLLGRTQNQAQFLAANVRPALARSFIPPVTQKSFPLFAAQGFNVLRSNPEFGSVSLVLDKTGEYVQVLRRSSTSATILESVVDPNSGRVQRTYLPFADRLKEDKTVKGWKDDPRLQSDYQACKETGRPVWTNVRLLGVQDVGQEAIPGIVCLAPMKDADGNFIGVVSVGLSLETLNRFLLGIKVGENGFAFLVEAAPDGSTKIVADPQPQSVASGSSTQLMSGSDVTEPVRKGFLDQIALQPTVGGAQVTELRFKAERVDYIGGVQSVGFEGGPKWSMCTVAPESDFLSSRRRNLAFFVGFGLSALATGIAVALLLARRFAIPLQALARETGKIRSLELEGHPVKATNIREIDELAESLEAMKSGLRSMEKLVPTEYARHLITSGQEARLGGERRHITTSFGDIVGFTRLSHQLPPEELVVVLAEYLDVLSGEVLRYSGTLDKFNGDDVMAFWGAPTVTGDHASMAVKTALSTLDRLDHMHIEWREQGRPVLSASFGIATGDVIVGNVGNQQRMNYTVIGDSVNLASRLQGLNKFYKTHILIGPVTAAECAGQFLLRRVDTVYVFGRDEPVTIYEPLVDADRASTAQRVLVDKTKEAFDAYDRRMWTRAAQIFEEVMEHAPGDGPSAILHARCLEFLRNPPPPGWNGAYELRSK